MATAKNITLKRFNGTDYDPLYPKTTGQQVFDSTLTTPLLNGSDKIDETFLPASVFGGMRIVNTISTSVTAESLYDAAETYIASNGGTLNGCYFIVSGTSSVDITGGADVNNGVTHTFSWGPTTQVGEENDSNFSLLTLEPGDWLILTEEYNYAGTDYVKWGVVNNTYALATVSAPGIMSAADKTKLDGIATNANNYTHPTYTTRSVDTTGVDVLDTFTSDSTGHVTGIGTRTLPNATTSAAGVMSAADKTKLDGIATGANLYVLPTAAANTLGGIEVGYTSTETNRAVILSGNDAYVNLPRQIPAVTLNGSSSTAPSFYAPTTGGTDASTTSERYVLEANGSGSAPTFVRHERFTYQDTEAAATSDGIAKGDILFEY